MSRPASIAAMPFVAVFDAEDGIITNDAMYYDTPLSLAFTRALSPSHRLPAA
ncbi:MAG: hypothetical protein R3C29_00700 [Dehalococcoidia bacterium]